MIEKHSKVFVPVSEASENSFSIYTAYSSKEKEWLLMEEKENVYVLSEQEFQEEKKKEAIAFAEWMGDKCNKEDEDGINPFLINNDGRWMQACGNSTSWTTEQLYELFNQQK